MDKITCGVFISHISEEKDVALKLQTLIRSAFSDAFDVFVSSDPQSLGGGEDWYHHILANLSKAQIILILLSPESSERPWINFEAGVGKGKNAVVIPLAFRGLSFDSLDYPLKGFQGYYLQALSDILKEISKRSKVPWQCADLAGAWEEINDTQIALPARKLALELNPVIRSSNWLLRFILINRGNRDIEPREVAIKIPSAILANPYHPITDPAVLEVSTGSEGGVEYTLIKYGNHRKSTSHHAVIASGFASLTGSTEPLCADLSPGMEVALQPISVEARFPLTENELNKPIKYQIFAKNMRSTEHTIDLHEKLRTPR
jgi:hypothetical protein